MQGSGKGAVDASKRGDTGSMSSDELNTGGADARQTATPMAMDGGQMTISGDQGGMMPADRKQIPADGMEADDNTTMEEADVRLDEAAQSLIGQHLKAVYSEIVQQPVPDELLKLLDELERKERS